MGNFVHNIYDSPIGQSNPTPTYVTNTGVTGPTGSLLSTRNDINLDVPYNEQDSKIPWPDSGETLFPPKS